MDPATLIPLADPLPIHSAWFDVLLIVTFTAHILFMNAMLGSAAIGIVKTIRGNDQLNRDVGQKLPPLMALTINMGVAPLLFLQVNYGQFDYVSSVLMGGWWLGIIVALLISYYGFYAYKFRVDNMGKATRNLLFGVSIIGLLYVGFMLTNNTTLMLVPHEWKQYFDGAKGFLNLNDPAMPPRFLHFMVGSLAIGGLFIALLGQWRKHNEYITIGMRWFTHATLANLLVGVWFLISIPRDIMLKFMGDSTPATATFIASLFGVVMLLSAGFRRKPGAATIWSIITVFLMACNRHWLRTFYLSPWFRVEDTPVTNQFGSLFLFLGFLVVGLVAIGYMLNLYFKAYDRRA
ncbi:conserved membrane protein of unknown function [Pseudodesulfovibrio profundus]|uniref:Uncharacterized protein n=1 Tax=Pseudodesulfovibrio profundus TaxID=57320 RepID=A0A2C8FB78_9BACT|nr:hypothetical protein [Pseudodesulfovibrio profundus]SOB59289.1 conserved membrane protein of unknown function [Pseudodesulfovibrio profundus]